MHATTRQQLIDSHALPDDTALTTREVAVLWRLSSNTLERLRVSGSGPVYIHGGPPKSVGINQKCFYFKKDLLAWQTGNRIEDAMRAAVRRQQV